MGCNYDLLKTYETRGGGGGDTRDLGGGGEGLRAVTHGDGVALGSNRLCAEWFVGWGNELLINTTTPLAVTIHHQATTNYVLKQNIALRQHVLGLQH